LKHAPNDVILRGTMCWHAYIMHARKQWALAGLKQALLIQPAHPQLLEWHALVENYWAADRVVQAQWIEKHGAGRFRDGRLELVDGNIYFNARRNEEAVEWYLKGIEYAPLEFELHFSLALSAHYAAERLMREGMPGEPGVEDRQRAAQLYDLAAAHMWK